MSSVESPGTPNSAQKKLKQRSILSMFGKPASNDSPKQQKTGENDSKKLDISVTDENADNKNTSTPVSAKQPRLPFKHISTSTPKSDQKSGQTKRKLSNDADNERSSKKGKTSESKENIAEVIDLESDLEEDVDMENSKLDSTANDFIELSDDSETEKKVDNPLLIKLPSCSRTKNKKRLASESKPLSKEENQEEDSVVYLDEEEIRKSCKKKKTGSSKKKKAAKTKKNLDEKLTIPEEEKEDGEKDDKKVKKLKSSKKSSKTEKSKNSDNDKSIKETEDTEIPAKSKEAENLDGIPEISEEKAEKSEEKIETESAGSSKVEENQKEQEEKSKDSEKVLKSLEEEIKDSSEKSEASKDLCEVKQLEELKDEADNSEDLKKAEDAEKLKTETEKSKDSEKAENSQNLEDLKKPNNLEEAEKSEHSKVVESSSDTSQEPNQSKENEGTRKSTRKSKKVIETPERAATVPKKNQATAEKSKKKSEPAEKATEITEAVENESKSKDPETDLAKPAKKASEKSEEPSKKVFGALDKFFKAKESKKIEDESTKLKETSEEDTIKSAESKTSVDSKNVEETSKKSLESEAEKSEIVENMEAENLDESKKSDQMESDSNSKSIDLEPMEVSGSEEEGKKSDDFKGFTEAQIAEGKKKASSDSAEIEVLSDSEDEKDKKEGSAADASKQKSLTDSALKKLTPKQLKRKAEFEQKRLEKEKIKQKEREEKEELRRKEREEKEEQKRREREEKEEQRKREKDEREKKRLAEIAEKKKREEQREEEKKKKEEQKEEEKRKKEEDRKKKEQEKEDAVKRKEQEKEEQENKKKKAAQAFTKFFFVQKKSCDQKISDDENSVESSETGESGPRMKFMPFRVKEQMMLAPPVRIQISQDRLEKLDKFLAADGDVKKENLYLGALKSGAAKPCKTERTWPQDEDECVVVNDELALVGTDIEEESTKLKTKKRAKFLGFSENQRPPYYGTWSKKTKLVGPRRPFGQDPKFFDYEVDSDDEWEEEEPGESLHGSDDEKDKDSEGEDYEVDNEFFVPHGHLSDEEMRQMDEDDDDNSPEAQKAKLKILQQEFAAEMKKKTERIKPRLVGCIWMTGEEDATGGFETLEDNEKKYHCSDIIWRILKAREMMCIEEEINLAEPIIEEPPEELLETATPVAQKASQRIKITDDSLKELILLVHGNCKSKKFLVREFQAYRLKKFGADEKFQEFLSISINDKISEIAVHKSCPESGPMFGKKCWIVKNEVIQEHFAKEEEPTIPNKWEYTLDPTVKKKSEEPKEDEPQTPQTVKEKSKKSQNPTKNPEEPENQKKVQESQKSSITKYTVDLTEDEKRQQISAVRREELKRPAPQVPAQQQPPAKKRVQLLMSVPRGQQIPEAKKNNLISQYLKTSQTSQQPQNPENGEKSKNAQVEPMETEVIEID